MTFIKIIIYSRPICVISVFEIRKYVFESNLLQEFTEARLPGSYLIKYIEFIYILVYKKKNRNIQNMAQMLRFMHILILHTLLIDKRIKEYFR